MATSSGNRTAYLVIGAGVVFVWAGIANKSVLVTLQELVAGKKPTEGPKSLPQPAGQDTTHFPFPQTIPGQGSPDPNIDNPTDSAGLQGLAMAYVGAKWNLNSQWNSFNQLESHEGEWSTTSRNPSTGAFGLAQALGHGTPSTNGTMSNMYGGYGLTDAEARAANSGSAGPQLKWMVNYIEQTYGTPNNAWMRWLSRNPHWY